MDNRAIHLHLILKELEKRKQTELPISHIKDPAIVQQLKFVEDRSRHIAACTTRRAGKTTGLAHRFFRTMLTHPNCLCLYIALTRDSAKNIMWSILQTEAKRFNIQADFTESNLTMTTSNNSRLQLFGADMKNFIERLRGIKTPGVAIDEAQSFKGHLEALVDDILMPGTADYEDGWIAVTGTPGPIPKGFFFDITESKKHNYSLHSWSLFDNPYLPDPRKFVQELKEQKGWKDDNPTLLREYYAKWVLDIESLLIKYSEEVNDYSDLPPNEFTYMMGIDLGFNDADAIAVVAWSHKSPVTYLVEEVVVDKQGLTELVEQINSLRSKYKISKMIIDEGGLGKKLAEEMRRRHKLPVHPADKKRKMENIAFLNDALRTGMFKAKSSSRFAQDSNLLQIDKEKSTPDKIAVKDSFHSDIIDAVLYVFKESPAFAFQKDPVKPAYGTEAWASEETKRMESEAEEYFNALEEAQRGYGLYD